MRAPPVRLPPRSLAGLWGSWPAGDGPRPHHPRRSVEEDVADVLCCAELHKPSRCGRLSGGRDTSIPHGLTGICGRIVEDLEKEQFEKEMFAKMRKQCTTLKLFS